MSFNFGNANEKQIEAIKTTDGPLLIIAGPGTGKTFTLVKRIAYLIVEKKVSPKEVMAVTFTEKAAKELISRITDELMNYNIEIDVNEMYVGTFHQICLKILKEFREYTILDKNYAMMDSFDTQYFIYKNRKEFDDSIDVLYKTKDDKPLKNWDKAAKIGYICSKIIEEVDEPEKLLMDTDEDIKTIGYIVERYRELLKNDNVLDFSSILSYCYNLFDDRPNNDADIKDLKNNIIDEFLNNVDSSLLDNEDLSKIDIAKSLRIVTGSKENMRPVNVGLMFFNERPDNFFRCAQIEVVDKPDPTGEGMTEKIFRGPLDKQLRDALMFIKNYIIKEKVHKIKGQAEAVRVFNYPYEAIEEALTNAVYHKSYRTPEPITVVSESDGLYINSVPGPDRSIKDSDIKIGKMQSVRYRNRRIGDFLKELDMAEGRNTGVPTILRTMKNNKSPKPVFKTDEDRSYFTVFLPINKDFLADGTTPMTTPMTTPIHNKLDNTSKRILEIISNNNRVTATEISKIINITRDGVRYHLNKLKELRIIEHKGKVRTGYWKIIKK